MLDATFATPDLSRFTGLDGFGLRAIGQRIEHDRAVIACRVGADVDWCRRCGCQGSPRDTVVRKLTREPFGWRPTILHVVVRRFRCSGSRHVWRQDTAAAAAPRAKLTKTALRWALEALVVQKLTVARVADALDVSWHTANDAVLAEEQRVLIGDPIPFNGVPRFDGSGWMGTPKRIRALEGVRKIARAS